MAIRSDKFMSLNSALNFILINYPAALKEPFASHPIAQHLRVTVRDAIQSIIGVNQRYLVQGSAGQGNWAMSPWAAVFDRLITESAQQGYYLVYLVKEDFSGVYLSLNQGVTSVRAQYGANAKEALRARANDFLARLGSSTGGLALGRISLAVQANSNLSAYYEDGSVCAKYYPVTALPTDETLASDLWRFMDLYAGLAGLETQFFERADAEDDEFGLGEEDLRTLRQHKRIERNSNLAAKAKKFHGYVCNACGFDFEKTYGKLGNASSKLIILLRYHC